MQRDESNSGSEIHYSKENLGTYFRVLRILALALIAMIAAILVPAFTKASDAI